MGAKFRFVKDELEEVHDIRNARRYFIAEPKTIYVVSGSDVLLLKIHESFERVSPSEEVFKEPIWLYR